MQRLAPFSVPAAPSAGGLEARGRAMNYEYTWLYRPRLFSFDLNFYSQFIPSRKNQPNEPMNYDRAQDEQGRWNFHALSRATEPADFNLP